MSKPTIADIRQRLNASILSDCLDSAGYRNQALAARIRPLDEAAVMVGRARTAAYMEVFQVEPDKNPYELELNLIDSLAADEIRCLPAPTRSASAPGASCFPPPPACAVPPAP